MKKIIYTFCVAIALVGTSCGEESKSETGNDKEEPKVEKAKYDTESPDYKMAMILCDCFESFDTEDPNAQMDAVGCFLEGMSDPDVQNSNEEGTKAILEDVCPESAKNFSKWQENMKNAN